MKHPKFRVRPHQPYWSPLVAMCDFAGDAELQAMRHCRRWASAPLLLGWSFSSSDSSFKLFFPRILYKTLILHLKLLKLTLYWSLHFKLWPFFWSHLFKYWLLPQSLIFKFNSIIGLFFSISCFSFKVWTLLMPFPKILIHNSIFMLQLQFVFCCYPAFWLHHLEFQLVWTGESFLSDSQFAPKNWVF